MKTGKESSQASVGQISAAEIGTSRANVAPSLATDIAVQINKARDELYLGHVLEVISRMERIGIERFARFDAVCAGPDGERPLAARPCLPQECG